MGAGWIVPGWLKEIEWENLMLLTLNIADVAKLPGFSPQMPMTITHRPNPIQHIYDLTFYSKQYLKSRLETHQGSSHFLMMRLKPDQETGTHGLPLKGCVIQTPVPPDTIKIPAELFLYHERVDEWTETIL